MLKNIVSVLIIGLIVAGLAIYSIRPSNSQIQVKPTPQKNFTKPGGNVIVLSTNNAITNLSNRKTTTQNKIDKYIKKYSISSFAYSTKGKETIYYLPEMDYSAISKAIHVVLKDTTNANLYFTLVGDPMDNIKHFKYCTNYRSNPIEFANSCGNDVNFYEVYAYGNFTTPFTMIIIINPVTTHVAYVFMDEVYDIFNTYNYLDYISRIIYKYNPTAAYIAIFDTHTIRLTQIPLIKGVTPRPLEATGTILGKPISIAQNKDYYILIYNNYNITRDGLNYIINSVHLDYYPIDYTKIEPIEPIIIDVANTNYLYVLGQTFTLIPTANIKNANITIINYKVLQETPVGELAVTYYS